MFFSVFFISDKNRNDFKNVLFLNLIPERIKAIYNCYAFLSLQALVIRELRVGELRSTNGSR